MVMTRTLRKQEGARRSKSNLHDRDFASMVEQMPVNVMVCDLDTFKITYVNESTKQTLRKLDHLLPVSADAIVGTCIDVFHKAPEHQRRLLRDPTNLPYQTHIKLGDETLDLLVTAIFDNKGRYVAPMLTWDIVTEALEHEQATQRLNAMVDQMPINVMMCDKDSLEITYVNQTSITTLAGLESLLPCKAADLLGQNIDIFHKNPAHQRAILADPSNLPHHARIKLGPETLNLQVSAIKDASGSYVGPMLSWSVISKQVGVADDFEQNVKGVVETVSSAATEMQASSEAMAATAEETASQASTVASAAEELSSSIQEISRQLSTATQITTEGVQQAKRSNDLVMGLSEAAEKVGEIVNLINDIAAQTNLLALNATIEAARAGDAGKGFAVVASEVKNLATQTAKATEEISSQINGIQTATGDAVKALQTIGNTIEQINEISTTIASAVTEQGAATEEVTRNVSGVHQSSSESGKAASEVLGAAGELAQQSEFLRGQVDEFLVEVRAM